MPADVTLFKTIIKIKDRAKFKDKFLGEDYDQDVLEKPVEPVAVISRKPIESSSICLVVYVPLLSFLVLTRVTIRNSLFTLSNSFE